MGVRRNQSSLSDADKARFVAAVRRMKADAGQPHDYDKYVQLHATVAASSDPDLNPAHRGPAFCPWHRYLLAKFEKDLQTADGLLGNDGTLTLPYWDWTQDDATSPNRQRGGMWHDDFLGGNGNPVSGSFNDWTQAPPGGGRLARDFGGHPAGPSLPRQAQVDLALDAHGFDCAPFSHLSPMGAGVQSPPAPPAAGAGGGSLAPGIYRVVTTYVNAPTAGNEGETRPSPETLVCLGGACSPSNTNATINVPSPPAQPGVTGYRTYVSAPNGAASTLSRQGGTTAIGTATTVSALAAGTPSPAINTTASFRNLLEGWFDIRGQSENHNRGHVWVGGSMLPATSPNDPVFFMHHCNVDRLWALWQFRHPGQNYPLVVPRVGGAGTRPEGLNDAMPPWTSAPELVRPVDVLNHTSITVNGVALGYTYDTDPPGLAVNVSP